MLRLTDRPVARYSFSLIGLQALIMPWNKSDWIKACNPIKLKEYLATGRPVVSTDFPALEPFRHLLRVADGPDELANAIADSLLSDPQADLCRSAVRAESWEAKAQELQLHLSTMGIRFSGHEMARNGKPLIGELEECSG